LSPVQITRMAKWRWQLKTLRPRRPFMVCRPWHQHPVALVDCIACINQQEPPFLFVGAFLPWQHACHLRFLPRGPHMLATGPLHSSFFRLVSTHEQNTF
jgi:hypothetical protein